MSTGKPRLVTVTDQTQRLMLAAAHARQDLGAPFPYVPGQPGGPLYDAEELRAWRLQHTSGATHGED